MSTPILSSDAPAKTVQIMLDDYVQKAPRSGSPGEIISLLYELYQNTDNNPTIQLFILFFTITIVVPFVGGLIVILYNFTKEDKKRPLRAFSWIPFAGTYLEFLMHPVSFLTSQSKRKGGENIFSVDTIVRESTCLYGKEGNALWNNQDTENTEKGHLMFMGNQMGKIFDPAYRANIHLYLKHADACFLNKEFFESNKEALHEYLKVQMSEVGGSSSSGIDLFDLSSSLYFHTMIFVFLGEEFARKHAKDLTDDLHQTQKNMKFTFVRFVNSYGIPTGASQQTDKFSKKLEKLIGEEIAIRKAGNEEKHDYLQYLINQKVSSTFKKYIWSHFAHLMLVSHAPTVASTGWTAYHLAADKKLAKRVSDEFSKPAGKTLANCLVETSRRYGGVQVSRTVINKFEIHGFFFYPGMSLFIAPAVVHLDEENYEDALQYLPDRWLNTNVEKSKKNGLLVTFNSRRIYEAPLESFFSQLAAQTTFPLLFRDLGLKLVKSESENVVRIDYWANISAPWAEEKIMVKFEKAESKKLK